MTLIVVVGAGASFDVSADRRLWSRGATQHLAAWGGGSAKEIQPPLTQDLFRSSRLFEGLLSRYDACAHLIAQARGRLASEESAPTLEDFLREYSERSGPGAHRALVAIRFLLRDLLWAHTDLVLDPAMAGAATNYASLLDRLDEWADNTGEPLAFVSFNYDLLLERAMEATWGREFTRIGQYVSDHRCMLVKPHGSANWVQEFVDESGKRPLIGTSAEVYQRMLHQDLEPAPRIEVLPSRWEKVPTTCGAGLPHLALPVTGKSEAMCPPEHLQAIETSVKDSIQSPLRLLTVGWRGAESYFMDFLANMFPWGRGLPPARCLFVTGDEESADGLVDEFNRRLPSDWRWSDHDLYAKRTSGFSGLVGSTELERLLAP